MILYLEIFCRKVVKFCFTFLLLKQITRAPAGSLALSPADLHFSAKLRNANVGKTLVFPTPFSACLTTFRRFAATKENPFGKGFSLEPFPKLFCTVGCYNYYAISYLNYYAIVYRYAAPIIPASFPSLHISSFVVLSASIQ